MALDNVILNDGQSTPVAHTFSYLSQDKGRVIRTDLTRTPDLPLTLTTGHKAGKVSGFDIDSHLQRIDNSITDADGVTILRANIRVMADVPRRIYSDSLADDLAAFIRNWATSANVRAWLRGAV